MSYPELEELSRAEQLFDDCKLDEALDLLMDETQFEGLDLERRTYFLFLKGLILIYQNKNEEAIKLGRQLLEESQRFNDKLKSLDGLFFLILGSINTNIFDEAIKEVERAEVILSNMFNISKKLLIQKKARIKIAKSWLNLNRGNFDLAEKCLKWVLKSQNLLGITLEIVWANSLMAHVMIFGKSRFNLAKDYAERAFSLAKEIKFNHFWIAAYYCSFGIIYTSVGEFKKGLDNYKKSLELFKKIKNEFYIANLFNNIGNNYIEIGDYKNALKNFETGLELREQNPIQIEEILDSLIAAALNYKDFERAQKYFLQLENLYNNKIDDNIEIIYRYNKALMLKRSSRIRDSAKAEELLKAVIETETKFFDITINAHIHICDILLAEYQISYNNEVLGEINDYISNLLTIAENSHSYLVFCESFILKAKLALIKLDLKAARRFLTQAQRIAESYGMKRLAMKISYEHDELLRQTKLWETLKESGAPLNERWKYAGLNEQMENMLKKRIIEDPELLDEEPTLLLILSEGGVPLFSHSFVEEISIDSQIFGGFLTTIDYFIREMFSEGLDRAIFGEYTLLMKSIPPLFISYIFRGDSYNANNKANFFIEQLQNKKEVWDTLLKAFNINQYVHLKDNPSLELLIKEIFIEKTLY